MGIAGGRGRVLVSWFKIVLWWGIFTTDLTLAECRRAMKLSRAAVKNGGYTDEVGIGGWGMRILDYGTPRNLRRTAGPTPGGAGVTRSGRFVRVSLLVYLFVWLVAVYFVARLVRIPF